MTQPPDRSPEGIDSGSDCAEEPVSGATLGERIDAARRRRGYSKARLAREAGLGYRLVVGYIRGEYIPSAEKAHALAGALGVTVDELLGVLAGQAPPFEAWSAFLDTPAGRGLTAAQRRALAAIPWPEGTQPTVAAYVLAAQAIALTEPREM